MNEAAQRLRAAQIKPGDHVQLASAPNVWLRVEDATDPALSVLAAPGGASVKAGRMTVTAVRSGDGARQQ